MSRRRWHVWLVLGGGTLLGLATAVYYLVAFPGTVGVDYRVYHVAAETALAGSDFYSVTPPDSTYHYLYPPVTVLAFTPLQAVGDWPVGFLALTLLSAVASLAAAWLLCQYVASLGYSVPRRECALVAAFLLVSSHAELSLVFGQVNHFLTAALVAGLVLLARGRQRAAGVLLAVPAYVKIVPGIVGFYLLRRRAWPAIAAAVGTALALTAVGVAVFGAGTHLRYVTDVLFPRRETAAFAGGLDPTAQYVTLRRPLSVLFPGVDPIWYALGAATLLFPVLAVLYWHVETHTDRVVAIHGTLVAGILFFPSLLLYAAFLSFPLVVLLYDLPTGRARRTFVAGALVSILSLSYGGLRRALDAVPVDAATSEAVATVLRPVFAFGTPVLYGCLLMLAGCVLYHVERGQVTRPESKPR